MTLKQTAPSIPTVASSRSRGLAQALPPPLADGHGHRRAGDCHPSAVRGERHRCHAALRLRRICLRDQRVGQRRRDVRKLSADHTGLHDKRKRAHQEQHGCDQPCSDRDTGDRRHHGRHLRVARSVENKRDHQPGQPARRTDQGDSCESCQQHDPLWQRVRSQCQRDDAHWIGGRQRRNRLNSCSQHPNQSRRHRLSDGQRAGEAISLPAERERHSGLSPPRTHSVLRWAPQSSCPVRCASCPTRSLES